MRGAWADLSARVRGLILVIWMYGLMAAMGLALAPLVAIGPRSWPRAFVQLYVRIALLSARLICGLRVEVRGEVPRGEVLVAAKHQSFLDILILVTALDRPRFVMKRSLLWAPVLGYYARRMGCVAVDRAKGSQALRQMVAETAESREDGGQLIIYPQGTRVAPGVKAPWKTGVAALYIAQRLPCARAATNAGAFWPRTGLARHPGVAVVEFLPTLPPGLRGAALMEALETDIEAASDRLLAEAREGWRLRRGG